MILNDYISFLRNIKYFFIFCILVTTTPRYSIVNCESDHSIHFNQSEQRLNNNRRNFKSTLRKRSSIKNRGASSDQLIQTRQEIQTSQDNGTFTNVTTSNQLISDGANSVCGDLCILGIMIGIVVIIVLIGFGVFFVIRKRKRMKIGVTSKRMTPSSPTTVDDFLKPSTSPPLFESRLNDEAEEFALKFPPQEEIPPNEHVVYIQSLGGAKAWEWVPDEDLLSQQLVSITNEGSVISFNKRIDSMVQTNYPFFIPQTEGDTIYEPPFEQPETMEKRGGQILHYFEITIKSNPDIKNTTIAIGLATKPYPHFRLPGWNIYSVGYHSNDGKKYNDAPSGSNYNQPWGEVGDTVGCGYNPDVGQVFFTKNGQFLGNAFTNIRHIWFPTIGANGPCTIETNFGDNYDKEFRYEAARGYGPGDSPRIRTD
ncbi:17916_t:CDS:2 [Racocetra persica]|uniref:17916_t:CDS:1 n=1 Tax=Racocetra persica TaxID=160502 RepID=A0ACA9LD06_9GLOM|nr:17916_t:CDS:2 [Racocetra persica]